MESTEVMETNTDNTSKKEEIQMAPKTEVHPNGGRCGLLNIGNTCYMNTGLQVSYLMGIELSLSVFLIFLIL